jgi:hypothetical protein
MVYRRVKPPAIALKNETIPLIKARKAFLTFKTAKFSNRLYSWTDAKDVPLLTLSELSSILV